MVVLASERCLLINTLAACRVAVLAPEAAGTSTLSAALAARFGVPLVSAADLGAAGAYDPSSSAGKM